MHRVSLGGYSNAVACRIQKLGKTREVTNTESVYIGVSLVEMGLL